MDAAGLGALIGVGTMVFVSCVYACRDKYNKRKQQKKLQEIQMRKRKESNPLLVRPLTVQRAKQSSMKELFSKITTKKQYPLVLLS